MVVEITIERAVQWAGEEHELFDEIEDYCSDFDIKRSQFRVIHTQPGYRRTAIIDVGFNKPSEAMLFKLTYGGE